ncbi:MAG: hypothetical protein HY556_04165 [Euryarchaeota archaeon]|nr:hypothetical protein [Euryarchaeota archaeon]
MSPPFDVLKYLYVTSARFHEDLAYYRDVLKAELVWNYHESDRLDATDGERTEPSGAGEVGANVAAFKVWEGPMILIADTTKRPPASCRRSS